MLQNELKVGDGVLVTSGTSTAEAYGFIGKVLTIVQIDAGDVHVLPFYVRDGIYTCWVNGVYPTELLKALI
jgi:hypothetical protein